MLNLNHLASTDICSCACHAASVRLPMPPSQRFGDPGPPPLPLCDWGHIKSHLDTHNAFLRSPAGRKQAVAVLGQVWQLVAQCGTLTSSQSDVFNNADGNVQYQFARLQTVSSGPALEAQTEELVQLYALIHSTAAAAAGQRLRRMRDACGTAVSTRLSAHNAWGWTGLQAVTNLASRGEVRLKGDAAANLYAAGAATMRRLGGRLRNRELCAWLKALASAILLDPTQLAGMEAICRAAKEVVAEVARRCR